jgi:hypothetical protein
MLSLNFILMSQQNNRCGNCGESLPPASQSHKCKIDSDIVYCRICDSYLQKHEYEDHVYCHSLSEPLNENRNVNIPQNNTNRINQNFNYNNNQQTGRFPPNNFMINSVPGSNSFQTFSTSFIPGSNSIHTFSNNNNSVNPFFDSSKLDNLFRWL